MPQFTNPPPAPQRGDRATFSGRVDGFLRWLIAFVGQLNIFVANLNARDAGGAGTFSFTFDSSTADSDPGVGKLRLDSANQNGAATVRIDNSTDSNIDVGDYIQSLQNGTSNVKGSLRIEKAKNPGSWILFDIFSVASATGYRNLSVVSRASSSANPFVSGDALVVYFDRAGDRGDGGNTPTQQQIRDAIGVLEFAKGGTNATTPNQALINLGGVSSSSLSAASGSTLIGFGARTVSNKLSEFISVKDSPYNAVGNGVADDTLAIQAALNASEGRRLSFPAGTYLTSGNQVPSNSHLVFERGAILRLANASNRPALQNINFKKAGWGTATYGLDSNIVIEGLYLDGNQANQVHTGGAGEYSGEYTSGLRFGGVTNLVLKDLTIFQARTFGIWCYGVYNLTAHNIRFDQYMAGAPDNQDGLHINGPATYLDIRNIRGSTNDDMIALNADDGPLGANVSAGAITSAVIDGVYPVNCLNGVRLLSATSRMDQIIVKNVVGSTRDVAVNQSPFGLGPGNVGSLIIDNIDVHCSNPFQPTTSNYYTVIGLDGIIESVSVCNIKNNRPSDNRPTVLVAGTANIGVLGINGLTIVEVAGSQLSGVKPITVYGLVDTMVVRGVHYFRDSSLNPTGNLIYIGANRIINLNCSDWVVQRLVEPIYLADGLLGNVTLSNIDDRGGLAGYALLDLNSSSGSTTNIDISNCTTGAGRKLVSRGSASVFGPRVTIDKAGASGANATLTGNQSLAAGAYTKLAFNVEVVDRIGEYDTTAQAFTVTQGPGTYHVNCCVDITVPTNPTDAVLALYKGGVLSRVLASNRLFGDALISGSVLITAQQGDVYDVRLYCTNATTAKNSVSTTVFYERLK